MPIGGGTFTVQNKILPGAYINFVSMGTNAKMGSRGVAALPLELNWGPDDKVFTMTATDFNATSLKVFGYGKITIRFARWKRRQVDEHEIQRKSDQVDRGNPGHSQRPNGPGSRKNDHPEML